VAWNETLLTMDLCFDDWEEQMKKRKDGKREVTVDSIVSLTLKVRHTYGLFALGADRGSIDCSPGADKRHIR
jgi:hypothetical protein